MKNSHDEIKVMFMLSNIIAEHSGSVDKELDCEIKG